MIPASRADLDGLIAEAERQTAEVRSLIESMPGAASGWRPAPERWSAAGHVAHLCKVNGPYLAAMEACMKRARAEGLLGNGPYRHPWLATWFARSMEPPPRRRVRTFKRMVPDPDPEATDIVGEFARLQGDLEALMDGARGLDLGRVRFRSPFLALLKLSLGTGFEALMAHNRRHVWLIRELIATAGFPESPTAG